MNTSNACRICLLADDNSEMECIFNDYPDEGLIVQKIELCAGVKLENRDDLPKKICGQCMFSLNISYEFRNLCQSNDLKLKSIIYVPHKVEIKDEPISDRASVLATPETVFLSELSRDDSSDYHPNEDDIKEEDEFKPPTKKKKKKISKPLPFPAKRLGRRPKPKEVQICELCGNVYSRPSLLIMHMRRHADEKPFSCEICQKKFTCQSEINRHMRVHTGVRPFKCQYCDRRFSDRSTNIKHERTHTNERPFECGTCGKAFTYSNVLKNHMLTHTGEKAFKCEICNKTFSRTHQLKQHLLTIIHQQKEAQLNIYNKEEGISNGSISTI